MQSIYLIFVLCVKVGLGWLGENFTPPFEKHSVGWHLCGTSFVICITVTYLIRSDDVL